MDIEVMYDDIIKELRKIVDVAKLYQCPGSEKYEEQLRKLTSFSVKKLLVDDVIDSIKGYKDMLIKKDYDYFSKKRNNKICLPEKDLTDFINSNWDDILPKHKRAIFRSMTRIYNYWVSSMA